MRRAHMVHHLKIWDDSIELASTVTLARAMRLVRASALLEIVRYHRIQYHHLMMCFCCHRLS